MLATLLLNIIVGKQLEKKNTYVWLLFVDFSSVFNTLNSDIIIITLKYNVNSY